MIVCWFALAYNAFMDLGLDTTVQEIIARLDSAPGGGAVNVEGTWGSFGPLLVAHICERIGRLILYVRPHIDDADKAADDLLTFTGQQIEAFGAWEGEEDLADATDEIRAQRLMLVSRISHLVSRVSPRAGRQSTYDMRDIRHATCAIREIDCSGVGTIALSAGAEA